MKRLALMVLCLGLASRLWGYAFITDSTGLAVKWPDGTVTMRIMIGQPPLTAGYDYATAVQTAMAAWNSHISTVQLSGTVLPAGSATNGNGVNEIVSSDTIYGEAFGSQTLAITTATYQSNVRTEADLIFNTAWTWSIYDGPLQASIDFQRVALHELGHVLGLGHPDQANPKQTQPAIMDSIISGLSTLQSDDIAGAQAMYGTPEVVPANDNFANAEAITLTNNAAQLAGNSANATKEAGEPNHGDDPGGHSIWWKWTATGNGSLTVTTLGSIFDTTLGIYTGSSVSALTTLASNDDVNAGVIRTSTATIGIDAGTTYYIAVDGWGGDKGLVTLNLAFTSSDVAPSFTGPTPSTATVDTGTGVQFSVSVSGSPTPALQWRRLPAGSSTWTTLSDGGAYGGTATNTLSIATTAAMSGDQFRCDATNLAGSSTSSAATLTVNKLTQSITFVPVADLGFTTTPLTLSASATSGLEVSFTVTGGPATVSGNQLTLTGTGVVTVEATQGGDATYAAAAPVQRSFTVTTDMASWALDYFTATERADSSISGPTADPDHDGLTNLVEYALGLDPMTASTSGRPEVAADSTNWTYTFNRPTDRPDLTYTVEVSTDLVNWTTTGVTLAQTASANGIETWRATYPTASASTLFFRLKVDQQ